MNAKHQRRNISVENSPTVVMTREKIFSLINSLTNDNSSQPIHNERASADKFSNNFLSKINTIINNIEDIARDESIVDDIDSPSQNPASFILIHLNM